MQPKLITKIYGSYKTDGMPNIRVSIIRAICRFAFNIKRSASSK